ncbi:hypothetical protein [Novosphingobium sp. MMS21-SN21R]|uniref:hypothetical protein n=1 Tax=Novosphingobium sp. MMS21-SN21R TaxID=2969298 RepID=UPI00288765A2|nr:hypothetical protein [Novosphingobium sp. MMS21-SN21R]MDT0507447.1 hypothetical protein [Novosphingobium sp. MMS21-SN21R]
MRLIGAFLTLCVALAVLKAAATVVALVVVAAVILSAITRPMETAGCLLLFALLGAIGQYPMAGLLVAGGLAALGVGRRT